MFSDIWNGILGFFESIIRFLHDLFEPVFGEHSWGWAIIALTLIVRVIILPLAVKQFRSMRAMQALQPELKALQKKYKVDRELMKKDPEKYRAKRQKMNEEMMALYKREGANPAASCLPLLAQAPIFIALFWAIRGIDELAGAPFYFFTDFIAADASEQGLAALVSEVGWPGWLLILLMSGTMFLTQKQMMARNKVTQPAADDGAPNMMQTQQKILLYVMPVFLAVISFQFPLGLLLYWCTTNVWQVAQQAIILREVKSEAKHGDSAQKSGGLLKRKKDDEEAAAPETPRKTNPGASSGKSSTNSDKRSTDAKDPAGDGGKKQSGKNDSNGSAPDGQGKKAKNPTSKAQPKDGSANGGKPTPPKKSGTDHLPRRGDRRS